MIDQYLRPTDFNNNKQNHERLETLERRHDHLLARIKDNPNLSYDAQECGSLNWAVRVLRSVLKEPK